MRYRSAWACRSAIYVRWAQKKGALVARPSGGAEVVPASGALFRPESAGREGQRRLLLIIPALAVSRLGRNEQLKALAPSNTSSFPRRVFCARVLFFGFAHPSLRGGGAPRVVRVLARHPLGLHVTRQARRLTRRLASQYGGRSPPGALTVAILGSGPALPSPAAPLSLRFGEHRIGHSELLAARS